MKEKLKREENEEKKCKNGRQMERYDKEGKGSIGKRRRQRKEAERKRKRTEKRRGEGEDCPVIEK